MKTIVVLANLFSGDMLKDFDYLKENLDMSKYNLISPVNFLVKDDKYDTDNFVLKIISSGINLSRMYGEFGSMKALSGNNKTTIYYGFATKEMLNNDIYVVNKNVVSTQEAYLNDIIKRTELRLNYITSDAAKKEFDTIQDLVRELNEVQ